MNLKRWLELGKIIQDKLQQMGYMYVCMYGLANGQHSVFRAPTIDTKKRSPVSMDKDRDRDQQDNTRKYTSI